MNRWEMEWYNEQERRYAESTSSINKNSSPTTKTSDEKQLIFTLTFEKAQYKLRIIKDIIMMSKLLNLEEYNINELEQMNIYTLLLTHQRLCEQLYSSYQSEISPSSKGEK